MAKSYKYSRSRKPLSLEDCKLRLTDAIGAAEKIIMKDEYKDGQTIQAIHALSGAVNRLAKLYEITDLVERVEQLEEEIND